MCYELEIRKLSGASYSLLLPFPNNFNYLIDAIARHEEVARSRVTVIWGGQRFVYDCAAEDGQGVCFGTFGQSAYVVIAQYPRYG